MMTFVYIAVAASAISLLALFLLDKLAKARAGRIDVEGSLREILEAKARGEISEAEFARRQAALFETVLAKDGRVRSDKLPALIGVVVLAIVAAASGIYLAGPSTPPIDDKSVLTAWPEEQPATNSGGDLNTVVKRLADKLANDPSNGEGWLLLAKTYGELRNYPEAAEAYAEAAKWLPPDADLLADWVDASVMANGRVWDGETRKRVQRAVALDPQHLKALALAGSEAFDRKDYKGAIGYWKRMSKVATEGSMDRKLAEANIAEAESMLSGRMPAPAEAAPTPSVGGTLSIASSLKRQVSDQDTVFITARKPDGKGPPLAVLRLTAGNLPIDFHLDDSLAILPGQSISGASEVLITAKVSKSGKAEDGPGDVYAVPVKTRVGEQKLRLELSAVR